MSLGRHHAKKSRPTGRLKLPRHRRISALFNSSCRGQSRPMVKITKLPPGEAYDGGAH
jgi:hypothetical protein